MISSSEQSSYKYGELQVKPVWETVSQLSIEPVTQHDLLQDWSWTIVVRTSLHKCMVKCKFSRHVYTFNTSFRHLVWRFSNILPRNIEAHVSFSNSRYGHESCLRRAEWQTPLRQVKRCIKLNTSFFLDKLYVHIFTTSTIFIWC